MIISADPNWQDHNPPVVTRRFVLAMTVMMLALMLIGIPFLLTLTSIIMPAPLVYQNLPFPICSPRVATACQPLADDETFLPGDVVPVLASRCVQDIFNQDQFLWYTVNRNIVSTSNIPPSLTRIILPDFATASVNGCTTNISLVNQLPTAIAPGQYYIEGVATTNTRFGARNAYWRTQEFTVSRP